MKRAIICGVCEKPIRESETYAVKITDYRLNDYHINHLDGHSTAIYVERKIRVCRKCVKKMGYKVGGLKVKKTEVKNAQQ